MTYLMKYLRRKASDFFYRHIAPAYENIHKQTGFRWDTLERRRGPKNLPDLSIKARAGWAFHVFGKGDLVYEAKKAAEELVAVQKEDGRWENAYKRPQSSLEDTFTTCDSIQFLSRMGYREEAEKGAQWLLHGEVMPQSGVEPGPPLKGLLSFKQANHIGSILRALVVTGHLEEAREAAVQLCSFQLPCGSWYWYAGNSKISMNYHDLTVAGIMDTYLATRDLRLLSPLKQALSFARFMIRSGDNLCYELYDNSTQQRKGRWFSGLTSFSMAQRGLYTVHGKLELASLLLSVIHHSAPYLHATFPYAVESRLIVVRGLTDFMEATDET